MFLHCIIIILLSRLRHLAPPPPTGVPRPAHVFHRSSSRFEVRTASQTDRCTPSQQRVQAPRCASPIFHWSLVAGSESATPVVPVALCPSVVVAGDVRQTDVLRECRPRRRRPRGELPLPLHAALFFAVAAFLLLLGVARACLLLLASCRDESTPSTAPSSSLLPPRSITLLFSSQP